MPTVAVKPELIRWAIDRSGLSADDLLKRFPKLNEWASGERQPTFRQLELFARATMSPFGAMFLDAARRGTARSRLSHSQRRAAGAV